jgi:hypothetical protein
MFQILRCPTVKTVDVHIAIESGGIQRSAAGTQQCQVHDLDHTRARDSGQPHLSKPIESPLSFLSPDACPDLLGPLEDMFLDGCGKPGAQVAVIILKMYSFSRGVADPFGCRRK